ncbi:MAG: UvrD-helicase domain-containing protein [Dysgonamonadaceae bacterium]|jgi:ATP-dependent exoDNAse (exonuclease V) beta subunit|nr:UvrD-helicase domain-containing protein [Dysgonamonadaceae bacterium]
MSSIKLYKASAGSGKTYTLALEYIKELLIDPAGDNYRHILAVTFTKEATGEMKNRMLAELYGLAFLPGDSAGFAESLRKALAGAGVPLTEKEIQTRAGTVLNKILHDYSRLNVTTIDSFFQRVLRSLARELGKGSRFNLEMNTTKVLQEAVHATIEKAGRDKQLLDWLTTYIEQRLDDDRNWRIENEILEFSQCIYNEFFQEHEQILRRQLDESPQLFKTLKQQQERIRKECREQFAAAGQTVGRLLAEHRLEPADFIRKGVPIQFIRRLAEGDYTVEVKKTIADCCLEPAAWTSKSHPRRDEITALAESSLLPLLNEVCSLLKIRTTSGIISGNLHQLGLIWDISTEIAGRNAEENRFMLSDTAKFLHEMIDDADAPFIYEKIGADIRHVMIDEFQDTSRLQWNNFRSLLSEIRATGRFSLIVGDVKQAIYRWRNGDWRILNRAAEELHASVESLAYNYRSEPVIVDFNNTFFTSAAEALSRLYESQFGESATAPFATAYNEREVYQKTPKTTAGGCVSVTFVPDKDAGRPYPEAMREAVFAQLKTLCEKGIPAESICLLTRTNREIIQLADYLSSLREAYPEMARGQYLSLVSGEAFQLKSSPAVKILIEALRVVADSEDVVCREQLAHLLACFRLEMPDRMPPVAARMPLSELVGYLYRLLRVGEIEGQSGYLFAFYDAIAGFLSDTPGGIHAFLRFWDEELKARTVPTGSNLAGVRAMTIHKSKGLQFHTVLIPFCDWSIQPGRHTTLWCGAKEGIYDVELLPVTYRQSMRDTVFLPEYQEETAQSWLDNLNLLYVAFTRAEQNLILLARHKKSLEDATGIASVSDLLQLSFGDRCEEQAGIRVMQTGVLQAPAGNPPSATVQENPLKETPPSLPASFVSEEFQPGRSIFKQSNRSREFVNPAAPEANAYLAHGNLMHKLFEGITHLEDIEKATDSLIAQGLIPTGERQQYIDKVSAAIRRSGTGSWFSPSVRSYSEYTILTEEGGTVVCKRPDRVLFTGTGVTVIDYKFGKQRPEHREQVAQYMRLLEKMHYPSVEGYVWYVEESLVCPVHLS